MNHAPWPARSTVHRPIQPRTVKRLAITLAVLILLLWVAVAIVRLNPPAAPSAPLAPASSPLGAYRANIGKTAYNRTNGIERGRIMGVEYYRAEGMDESVIVYRVDRDGSISNAPVDNTDAR